MFDVTAVGELLIDFTPAGHSAQGHALYEQNPGGAPANVLACLSRLGRRTAFIGKVGEDPFGYFLARVLTDAGVDCRSLKKTARCHTTLAFVHLDAQNDRSFSFYRDPGADVFLSPDDVPGEIIGKSRFFHFGSVSLTAEPARAATLFAVQTAHQSGCIVSYDPNLRLMLWPAADEARQVALSVMPDVALLKLSEEELFFLSGEADLQRGAEWFFQRWPLGLILITLGPGGAFAATRKVTASHAAFAVNTIDTTGAGDAFMGAFIDCLLRINRDLASLTANELGESLAFANAAGSLATTRMGAIPSLPALAEIEQCLAECPILQ